MKTKPLIATLAGGALLVALLAWAFAPRPVAVETARADHGLFEITIDDGEAPRTVRQELIGGKR